MTQPTTTIRVPLAAKLRLAEHANPGDSMGDVVMFLGQQVPTSTEVHRARDAVAAYLRTHLERDFGDQDEETAGEALWQELAVLQHGEQAEDSLPTAAILDHTALNALAGGDRLLARLLYTQPCRRRRAVFAPTQATYTANVQQNGIARHLERLGVVQPVPFDFDAVLIVGEQVPTNATPAMAHVVHVAMPSQAWPVGRPVLTKVPAIYQPYRLKVRPLPDLSR